MEDNGPLRSDADLRFQAKAVVVDRTAILPTPAAVESIGCGARWQAKGRDRGQDNHGRGGGFPGRVHRRRQRRRRAAVRLARQRRRRLALPGRRVRGTEHPGLGRLHAGPVRRHGCECHRTAGVRHDQRLGRQAGRRRARLRRHPPAADGLGVRRHCTVHVRRRRREGDYRRQGVRRRPGRRRGRRSDRRPGAQARADRPGGGQSGPGGPRSGRPFFATAGLAEPLRLENPTTIVRGDRVTHLVYDVSR